MPFFKQKLFYGNGSQVGGHHVVLFEPHHVAHLDRLGLDLRQESVAANHRHEPAVGYSARKKGCVVLRTTSVFPRLEMIRSSLSAHLSLLCRSKSSYPCLNIVTRMTERRDQTQLMGLTGESGSARVSKNVSRK